MAKRKQLKCWEFETEKDWFLLNSTPKRKNRTYDHEVACADLFVAYLPHFNNWVVEHKLVDDRVDRGILVNGVPIYFEVDMCTENIQILYDKVQNAIRETSYRFHVVYVFAGEENKVLERAKKFGIYLASQKRNDQFLVASHQVLINDPLGDVLFAPTGEIKSINSLL